MHLVTVDEARLIDARAQKERGLSGEILMETAGALSGREIRQFIKKESLKTTVETRGFVAVVCGSGGNGADGLVAARHLESAGLQVRVYLTESKSSHPLFAANLKRLPKSIERNSVRQVDELVAGFFATGEKRRHHKPVLIVDALLGLGTSREVTGDYATLIGAMNSSDAPTISLDLPSGLDADTGCVLGLAICAKMTLTFGFAKRGFFVNEGPAKVGRLKVLPIGFPRDLVSEVAKTQTGFDHVSASRFLPKRASSSNKSSHGRLAVFAGQPKMIGAGLLAGLAAMRSGVGYVTMVTHLPASAKGAKARAEIARVAPEFLTLSSADPDLWEKIGAGAAVIGPGFGVGPETLQILKTLEKLGAESVVIDADALTTLAQERKAGRRLPMKKTWILTPHAGELARLIGGEAKDLEAHRFDSVERAARELKAIVLFKGFRTVISDGNQTAVILSGNSALAKAGSGDTLAGFIGGFLAQKVAPFEAACLGAYVHGRIADEWLESGRDVLSLQPTDIAARLPQILKRIRSSR